MGLHHLAKSALAKEFSYLVWICVSYLSGPGDHPRLTSVCQVRLWDYNVVTILVVDFAVVLVV